MSNPAAEICSKVKAVYPEATVVERGHNHIKHRIADAPDGRPRYTGDYFIGPIHYGGPNWQEIDTAFQPSVAPWDWEMTEAGFHIHALSRLDAGQAIEYRNGSEWVRFQPMALQYSNGLDQIQPIAMPENIEVAVDNDTLMWADGYGPGRSLSWQTQMARLAKRLIIGSPTDLPSAEQYILDGGNSVLELNLIFAHSSGVTPYINGQPWTGPMKPVDTQSLVEFRDGEGNILWWFSLPRSWDAEGNQQLGTLRFKKIGNALYVSHRVPLAFVQAAAYPLVIDVDVDDQVDQSTDDGDEGEELGDMNLTRWDVVVSASSTLAWRWWGGLRFRNGPFPAQGSTIDVAYFEAYGLGEGFTIAYFDIHAEDSAAPPTLNMADFNITTRTRTTAFVLWDEGGLAGGVWHQSPSIVDVIQELADDYNSSAIMLILKPRTDVVYKAFSWRSWDWSDHTFGAKLHIEYTAAAIGADEMMAAIGQTGGGGDSGGILAHSRQPPEIVAY